MSATLNGQNSTDKKPLEYIYMCAFCLRSSPQLFGCCVCACVMNVLNHGTANRMDSEKLFYVDYIKILGVVFNAASIAKRFNTTFHLTRWPLHLLRVFRVFFFIWPSLIFYGYYPNFLFSSAFRSPKPKMLVFFLIHLKAENSSSSDIDINMVQASLTNIHINVPLKIARKRKHHQIYTSRFHNCSRLRCINLMFTVTLHCVE